MWERLKKRAKELKNEISTVYYAYRDPDVGLLPKIVVFITLGYALSPIDLIPDFIPVLGYLDDLIILPALIGLSLKLIPEEVLDRARERAAREPVEFRKNWLFALGVIIIWIVPIVLIVFFLKVSSPSGILSSLRESPQSPNRGFVINGM